MKSLRCLYRVGRGPSSSHTIAPCRVANYVKKQFNNIESVDVYLFGSLALTGVGHLTDVALKEEFLPIKCNINFDINTKVDHPNSMKFVVHLKDGDTKEINAVSVGGGAIKIDGKLIDEDEVYPERNFEEIKKICKENNWNLPDYVRHYEGDFIFEYLENIYYKMVDAIDRGLNAKGLLPGKLKIERRAHNFINPIQKDESDSAEAERLMIAYAFAVGEENASGGIVVTAPTCGSAATLPAVLKYYKTKYNKSNREIAEALAVAGVIGNVIKQNASISGAEAGCQAEIGSACSMAAAAYSYLKQLDIDQIEYAAEVAMEHSLGSTCDPVGGYVIIPCIERNAVAANRAITAGRLAEYATHSHSVSFDSIVSTMLKTGKDLKKAYRETAKGGLATQLKGE